MAQVLIGFLAGFSFALTFYYYDFDIGIYLAKTSRTYFSCAELDAHAEKIFKDIDQDYWKQFDQKRKIGRPPDATPMNRHRH